MGRTGQRGSTIRFSIDTGPPYAPIDAPRRVLGYAAARGAADTEEALRQPLLDLNIPWTLESRTGDTSASMRARQSRRLPTALVTTPESLSLMLTRDDVHDTFSELRVVVVDEWHELMGSKRGVQVELALARLRAIRPPVRTWGLSATIGNLDDAMAALLGRAGSGPGRIIRGVDPEVVIDALIPPVVEAFPGPATSAYRCCRSHRGHR